MLSVRFGWDAGYHTDKAWVFLKTALKKKRHRSAAVCLSNVHAATGLLAFPALPKHGNRQHGWRGYLFIHFPAALWFHETQLHLARPFSPDPFSPCSVGSCQILQITASHTYIHAQSLLRFMARCSFQSECFITSA